LARHRGGVPTCYCATWPCAMAARRTGLVALPPNPSQIRGASRWCANRSPSSRLEALSGSNQPVQPRQTNDLGTLENRCTVGEQQHWHIMDAAKRIRGRRLNDFAAQPMVQTLDEPVASIAQREQLVTGMGEVLSRLQGAHGSLESGGRDQSHVFSYHAVRCRHHTTIVEIARLCAKTFVQRVSSCCPRNAATTPSEWQDGGGQIEAVGETEARLGAGKAGESAWPERCCASGLSLGT